MSEVTRLLDAAVDGDRQAAADLLPFVYDELRRLATARMAAENPAHTLQATALVHEAYLRLVANSEREPGADSPPPSRAGFANRAHFFAAAAEAMRRILVENARRKGRDKHGGGRRRVNLDEVAVVDADNRLDDVLALDEALSALAKEAPDKAELVKLRYFGGLTLETAAESLGISLATAKRRWTIARAWLYDWLSSGRR